MKNFILPLAVFAISSFANAQSKSIIYFDSNKSELKKESKQMLDSLTNVLTKINSYQLLINAYCDNTGSDELNQTLSEERANTVLNYFKNKNIVSQFMVIKGFGENAPLASNDTENGKSKNRRAEINVIINAPIPVIIQAPPPPIASKTEELKSTNTLKDLEIGKTLILKNLNFEGGTAILLTEAKPSLEILLKTMIDNPTLEIEIAGHVCCADDMPLSVLRAKTVYSYLVKNGISEKRMAYRGYSRNKPIFEDDSFEENARANRRVEIKILKK